MRVDSLAAGPVQGHNEPTSAGSPAAPGGAPALPSGVALHEVRMRMGLRREAIRVRQAWIETSRRALRERMEGLLHLALDAPGTVPGWGASPWRERVDRPPAADAGDASPGDGIGWEMEWLRYGGPDAADDADVADSVTAEDGRAGVAGVDPQPPRPGLSPTPMALALQSLAQRVEHLLGLAAGNAFAAGEEPVRPTELVRVPEPAAAAGALAGRG